MQNRTDIILACIAIASVAHGSGWSVQSTTSAAYPRETVIQLCEAWTAITERATASFGEGFFGPSVIIADIEAINTYALRLYTNDLSSAWTVRVWRGEFAWIRVDVCSSNAVFTNSVPARTNPVVLVSHTLDGSLSYWGNGPPPGTNTLPEYPFYDVPGHLWVGYPTALSGIGTNDALYPETNSASVTIAATSGSGTNTTTNTWTWANGSIVITTSRRPIYGAGPPVAPFVFTNVMDAMYRDNCAILQAIKDKTKDCLEDNSWVQTPLVHDAASALAWMNATNVARPFPVWNLEPGESNVLAYYHFPTNYLDFTPQRWLGGHTNDPSAAPHGFTNAYTVAGGTNYPPGRSCWYTTDYTFAPVVTLLNAMTIRATYPTLFATNVQATGSGTNWSLAQAACQSAFTNAAPAVGEPGVDEYSWYRCIGTTAEGDKWSVTDRTLGAYAASCYYSTIPPGVYTSEVYQAALGPLVITNATISDAGHVFDDFGIGLVEGQYVNLGEWTVSFGSTNFPSPICADPGSTSTNITPWTARGWRPDPARPPAALLYYTTSTNGFRYY
jgi:hypothetical protein